MLVIIPTFRRLLALKQVLRSVFNSELPQLPGKPRLAIVNNFPPNAGSVRELVSTLVGNHVNAANWKVIHVDRERTLSPVDNWYGAVQELSGDGEIVFLHGDDDLLMGWGLKARYEAIQQSDADLLLAKIASGLSFLDDKWLIMEEAIPSYGGNKPVSLTFETFDDFVPAHMGNQCFRYGERFNRALQLIRKWAEELEWLDYDNRTLMFPYYFPIAYMHLGYRVFGLNEMCQVRGVTLEEKIRAPFGVPGWNTGFVSLVASHVLRNRELITIRGLDRSRKILDTEGANWYLTYPFDSRLQTHVRKELLRRVRVRTSPSNYANGLRRMLPSLLRLRSFRTRLLQRFRREQADHFLEKLK